MLKRLKVSVILVVALLNVAVIVLMALFGYAGQVSPVAHPRLAALTLAFPFFFVADVAFIVVWLCVCRRWTLLPIAGLFVCASPVRHYLPINLGGGDKEEAIKIVSYNIGGLTEGGDENMMANGEEIIDYLVASDADIICLQEMNLGEMRERLTDTLRTRLPYSDVQVKVGGTDALAVYSRYPILRKQTIDYESVGNVSAAFTLDIDGEETVIVNNHLETNSLSLNDRANFKEIVQGETPTRVAKDEGRYLLDKVARAGAIRAPQAEAVAHFVDDQLSRRRAVIVCGDFNDNPLSYTVREIGQQLTDCYVAKGFGPGWSYHKNAMYVRIDHLFCSEEWEPVDAKVDGKIAASDHYPVICWLKKRINR